ncbi:MAG TPA: RNA polymerase sigma factor [Gemmatimonadales bacterium]|nr:RNA polymerase sigma factor [Gemmatimonadales bacterium]
MEDVRDLLRTGRYEAAFERLLDVYDKRIFRMAFAFVRDSRVAEEVTQDVFLKVWRALPSYDGRAAPSTWLFAIARNTCVSAARAQSYRRTRSLDDVPEPAVPELLTRDIALEEGLSRLPEALRLVLTLFYYEQRKISEVAALLDLPEGTVKSRLYDAKRALAKIME